MNITTILLVLLINISPDCKGEYEFKDTLTVKEFLLFVNINSESTKYGKDVNGNRIECGVIIRGNGKVEYFKGKYNESAVVMPVDIKAINIHTHNTSLFPSEYD